ncbi:MAG: SPASM domain-containing protein [Bacteroidales bacterium]|nr:SPASM domain-containing protein [Bacteroidales bacterium]
MDRKPAKCHAPKVYIRVGGDGTIGYCNNTTWGNIRDNELADVFSSQAFNNRTKQLESCNKCVSACTDISNLNNNPFYALKIGLEYLKYQL